MAHDSRQKRPPALSGAILILQLLLAIAGSVCAGPPAGGPSAELLIWGGGKTAAEAQASLDQYRDRSAEWSDIVVLAPDYPRILESASVPGLKPGVIIVVLGVCAAPDTAAAMKYLKALEPGVYSRTVSWSGTGSGSALACPGLAGGWSFHGVERARTSDGELAGALFLQNETTEGGEFEFKRWKAFFALRGPKRELQSRLVDVSRSDVSILKAFKAGASGLILDEEYTDPLCTGAPAFKQYGRTRTYSSSSGDIRAGEEERLIKQGPCRYPEIGR